MRSSSTLYFSAFDSYRVSHFIFKWLCLWKWMKKHNCHFLTLAVLSYQPILTMLQIGTSIHMIQTSPLTGTDKWIKHLVLLIQMIAFWIQIINFFFKDFFFFFFYHRPLFSWVFMEFVMILLLFCLFWPRGMRDLSSPYQGSNPHPLSWKVKS